MKTNPVLTILSKPRVMGPAVFVAVGVAKACQDYKKEKPETKTTILLKDSAILTGSILGFALVNPMTRAFCGTKFVELFVNRTKKIVSMFYKVPDKASNKAIEKTEKVMKNVERVIKESAAGTINTFAGIVGAIYANELMHKYVFSNPRFVDKFSPKPANSELPVKHSGNIEENGFFKSSSAFSSFNYVNKEFAKNTANRLFVTISDVSGMKVLEKPMIALTGFSVANTKGYHNKLKKTTYELLANTLIPTIFVTAMSLVVENKRPLIKYPTLFFALTLGAAVGSRVADFYKAKINSTIDSLNIDYIKV